MERLLVRPRRHAQNIVEVLPLRVWRAFNRRHLRRTLFAQRHAVTDLARQFIAEDDAAAASNVIDIMLASHGIATKAETQ